MMQILSRFARYLQQVEAECQVVARAILEAEEAELPATGAPGATAAGDRRRPRGIPAIGRGCSGAILGTRPGESLMRRENGRRSY